MLYICCTIAGVVMKCPDPRHAMVEFADKEQVLVPTRLVIATSGAVARPQLMVWKISGFITRMGLS